MSPKRSQFLVGLALFLITLLVYGHTCLNGFTNYDDPDYVQDNPHVTGGLTVENIAWAFTTNHASNWHPLTWLSLQLNAEIFGVKGGKWGFHLTNILLHAANTVLLFWVFQRLTGCLWRSAAVAALFALHPLHVESVAWISERKDVLSTFFGFLTIGAYTCYVERPSWFRYGLMASAFSLSLLAKPMLVTLPCLLLLLDYWPLGRFALANSADSAIDNRKSTLRWLVVEKLPLVALVAALCVVTVIVQYEGGAIKSFKMMSLQSRVENSLVAYVRYLGKMFWPRDLAVLYPHPHDALPTWQVVGAALLLAAVTGAVLAAGRRKPYLPVGWFWYLGTLVPVIGLVQVGPQALADRYTYVPLIGIFIMGVWGLADLAGARPNARATLAWAFGLVLLACAGATWLQVRHWHDELSLWLHNYEATPQNYYVANNIGYLYTLFGNRAVDDGNRKIKMGQTLEGRRAIVYGKKLIKQAKEHFLKAIEWEPNFPRAHHNLAKILESEGKKGEAAREFLRGAQAAIGEEDWFTAVDWTEKALVVAPDDTAVRATAKAYSEEALVHRPNLPGGHYNLAMILALEGKKRQAARKYLHAARMAADQEDFTEAPRATEAALDVAPPGDTEVWTTAKAYSEEAIAEAPELPGGHYNLATILAREGKKTEAAREFVLAAQASASKDKWPRAVRSAEKALELTPAHDKALRAQIERDLEHYRKRRDGAQQ
jgi:tetratricopeptide (TPR) repeat protein